MNRRSFLKRAAALGAALALPTRGVVAEVEPVPQPKMTTGGVISKPMLTMMDDSYPDGCVIPLHRTDEFADEVAKQFGADIIGGVADGVTVEGRVVWPESHGDMYVHEFTDPKTGEIVRMII